MFAGTKVTHIFSSDNKAWGFVPLKDKVEFWASQYCKFSWGQYESSLQHYIFRTQQWILNYSKSELCIEMICLMSLPYIREFCSLLLCRCFRSNVYRTTSYLSAQRTSSSIITTMLSKPYLTFFLTPLPAKL